MVVGHRDRLGRMNTELAGAALAAHGRRLVVVGNGVVAGDLVGDVVEVLAWLCAGVYCRGPAGNRALKAVGCARQGIGHWAMAWAGLWGGGG